MDQLLGWDYSILHFINVACGNQYLDKFWLIITSLHKQYLLLSAVIPVALLLTYWKYGMRSLLLIGALGLTVGITDSLSYRLVKTQIPRARPFENPELTWVRKVGDAQGPSFPSNHAANTAGAAVVLAYAFYKRRYDFYTFAALVGFSRVALGVHYPSDVLAGALLGIIVGKLVTHFLVDRYMQQKRRRPDSGYTDISGDWRTRSRRISEN